ncbi:MAG: rhodanese-like domain-containing protein [Thermoleophilia bacterium]|nr:rhodanese-like domain-containing protein [Thermoleophilia bacterium]
MTAAAHDPDPISLTDACAELDSGAAVLVDVRDAAAWREGHARGAVHVPIDQLGAHLAQLPTEVRVITTCGGGTRGVRAARELLAAGRDAAVLTGGMRAWVAAGLDVETG